jgi:hypothetical protein
VTPAERLLAELCETYEPEELPGVIASLQRAAIALRGKPVDGDYLDLSWREFMTQTGVEIPADFEIPGVTDRISGALDLPLRELEKHIGPHEFRQHLIDLDAQLDRENADLGRRIAARFAFPSP